MLSLVIPALNAAPGLDACLRSAEAADEIVLVDGGSTDETVSIARRHGVRILSSPGGRGLQLAAGAQAASGDWLLFLHADTRLTEDWAGAIHRHIAGDPHRAACFRFRLDAEAWQARLVEKGVALRVRLLGLAYGDQGLLISRALYDALGGYRPLPLMEDVDLVRRIRRRRLRVLEAEAVTSADRWRQDGWLKRSARNLACLGLYGLGAGPERIRRLYSA